MIKGSDNKVRYVKPIRIEMYRAMIKKIESLWGKTVVVFVYGTLGYVG